MLEQLLAQIQERHEAIMENMPQGEATELINDAYIKVYTALEEHYTEHSETLPDEEDWPIVITTILALVIQVAMEMMP